MQVSYPLLPCYVQRYVNMGLHLSRGKEYSQRIRSYIEIQRLHCDKRLHWNAKIVYYRIKIALECKKYLILYKDCI